MLNNSILHEKVMRCGLSLLLSHLISNTKKGRLNQTFDYCGWDTVNKQVQSRAKYCCDAHTAKQETQEIQMQNFIRGEVKQKRKHKLALIGTLHNKDIYMWSVRC